MKPSERIRQKMLNEYPTRGVNDIEELERTIDTIINYLNEEYEKKRDAAGYIA